MAPSLDELAGESQGGISLDQLAAPSAIHPDSAPPPAPGGATGAPINGSPLGAGKKPWWVLPDEAMKVVTAGTPMQMVEAIGLDQLVEEQVNSPAGVMAGQIAAAGAAPAVTALDALTIPLRATAGGIARLNGQSKELIPPLPENPGVMDYWRQVVPNISFLDLADLDSKTNLGTMEQYVDRVMKENPGADPAVVADRYKWKREFAMGVGILEDFFLDPLAWMSFMPLNKAAQTARQESRFKTAMEVVQEAAAKGETLNPDIIDDQIKIIERMGQYAENGRDLVQIHLPMQPEQPLASVPYSGTLLEKGVNRVKETWVGESAARMKDALDYRFGVDELDAAATENMFETQRRFVEVKENYLDHQQKLGLSDDEKKVVARMVEATPNLLPESVPVAIGPDGVRIESTPRAAPVTIDERISASAESQRLLTERALANDPALLNRYRNQKRYPLSPEEEDIIGQKVDSYRRKHSAPKAQAERKVVRYSGGELKPEATSQRVGRGKGVYNEEYLSRALDRAFESSTSGLKNVNPHRRDVMVEAALGIKRANAKMIELRYGAGLLSDEDLATATLKRYLAHVPTEEGSRAAARYRAGRATLDDVVKAEEEALSRQLERAVKGSSLSSFNPGTLKRKVELSFEAAEQAMAEKFGVKRFYVEDPFVATAMRWAQTEKAIADKKFLDTLAQYGIRPNSPFEKRQLIAKGWMPIVHPEFNRPVTMMYRGVPTRMKFEDMLFPPHVADKVGFWIKPNQVGGRFGGWLASVNGTFKSLALFSPGYHLQNTAEDLFKYYADGGTVSGLTKAMQVILGGKMGARGTIKIGGKTMPLSEAYRMVRSLKTHARGIEEYAYTLQMGKGIIAQLGMKASPRKMVKSFFRLANEIGEKSTNLIRYAMYIDLRDRGYEHLGALFRTEQVLFDYRRASKTVVALRTFWDPFINSAIKTAFITPELIGKSPAAYNFLINNLPKYLSWTLSDPVTNEYIQQVIPAYAKFRDPVASPLLPGDSLMTALFQPPKNGKWVALVTPDFGVGILKRFAVWDSQVWKYRLGFGPAMSSIITMVSGVDQWGTTIDADPERPDYLQRILRGAMEWGIRTAFATPGVWKQVKAAAGMQDPEFAPSRNMQVMQALFGQFIHFDNLSKDYLIKTIAFQKAYTNLQKQLQVALLKDAQSRNAALFMADKPKLFQWAYNEIYPRTSLQIWTQYVNRQEEFLRAQAGMSGLGYNGPQKSATAIIAEMKHIVETTKRMNETYYTMSSALLANIKAGKVSQDQLKDTIKEIQERVESAEQPEAEPTPEPSDEPGIAPQEEEPVDPPEEEERTLDNEE